MSTINKNWRPYVYGEPSTYPKKDKAVLIWTGIRFITGTFNGRNFVEDGAQVVFNTPVFWQYIDKVPARVSLKIEKICHNNSNLDLCVYAGNGFCEKVDSPESCPFYSEKKIIVALNE